MNYAMTGKEFKECVEREEPVVAYVIMARPLYRASWNTWFIGVLFDKKQAQEHIIEAVRKAKEWENFIDTTGQPALKPPEGWNPHDPEFHKHWMPLCGGVNYFYLPIRVIRKGGK